MFGTILYFMCIYLCSHIICYNEKENTNWLGLDFRASATLISSSSGRAPDSLPLRHGAPQTVAGIADANITTSESLNTLF